MKQLRISKTRRIWTFFDVDGTLTKTASIWEFLHRRLGIWETQGQKNLDSFQKCEIDYNEFARLDALGYKGLHRNRLNKLIDEIEIRKGVFECFRNLKSIPSRIILLSTGLNILVDRFASADLKFSNELLFKNDICTGAVKVNIPMDGKKSLYESILQRENIKPADTAVIGDSMGDLAIMKCAGFSIAVDPIDPVIQRIASCTIDGEDLTVIPNILRSHFNL